MDAVDIADGDPTEHGRRATNGARVTAHPLACAIGALDDGIAAHEAAWKASSSWSCMSGAAACMSSTAHT